MRNRSYTPSKELSLSDSFTRGIRISKTPLFRKRNLKKGSTPCSPRDIPVRPSSQKSKSLLSKLRTRQENQDIKISPEIASNVVKQYILPMFEADSRKFTNNMRLDSFGICKSFRSEEGSNRRKSIDVRNLSYVSNTVYSELKLSEQLSYEIQKLKEELSVIHNSLKDTEQTKEAIQKEYDLLKVEYFRQSSSLEVLNFQYTQLLRSNQKAELARVHLTAQVAKYRNLYHEINKTREDMINQIHDERAKNDIRYYTLYIPLTTQINLTYLTYSVIIPTPCLRWKMKSWANG